MKTPAVRMLSACQASDRAHYAKWNNPTPAKDLGCAAIGNWIASIVFGWTLEKGKLAAYT
jgi:hypothetical protein